MACGRLGLGGPIRHETGWASVDAVYRGLDRAVADALRAGRAKGVYAYEDGAKDSFIAAKEVGAKCFYDLPIAHWRTLRRLLEEEAQRLPEWASTLEGLRDSGEKLARKDAELQLADHVLVASSFTQHSLTEHFGASLKISVAPYGCPSPRVERPTGRQRGEPLRLLYAGHLAQRKGIADLIAALELIEIDWRLTLAGPRPTTAPASLDRFLDDPRCDWLGAIPHAELLARMTQAHAFVFPSIVEGFGVVITEAMSSGLPVITTPNTAGPDVMTDGREGFIVPIRDPEAVAQRITQLADDETLRHDMGGHALDSARRASWKGYETQIAGLVKEWLAA